MVDPKDLTAAIRSWRQDVLEMNAARDRLLLAMAKLLIHSQDSRVSPEMKELRAAIAIFEGVFNKQRR